jgi:hypothetical protein
VHLDQVAIEVHVYRVPDEEEGVHLVHFVRISGDPMAFKRMFQLVRRALGDVIDDEESNAAVDVFAMPPLVEEADEVVPDSTLLKEEGEKPLATKIDLF